MTAVGMVTAVTAVAAVAAVCTALYNSVQRASRADFTSPTVVQIVNPQQTLQTPNSKPTVSKPTETS